MSITPNQYDSSIFKFDPSVKTFPQDYTSEIMMDANPARVSPADIIHEIKKVGQVNEDLFDIFVTLQHEVTENREKETKKYMDSLDDIKSEITRNNQFIHSICEKLHMDIQDQITHNKNLAMHVRENTMAITQMTQAVTALLAQRNE